MDSESSNEDSWNHQIISYLEAENILMILYFSFDY